MVIIQIKLLSVSGISEDGISAQKDNGIFEVVSAGGKSLSFIAHPSSCEEYQSGTINEDGVLSESGTYTEPNRTMVTIKSNEIVYNRIGE